MTNNVNTDADVSEVKSVRHYWQRSDSASPWWPWGLLCVLGLVLLFTYGVLYKAPAIEAQIERVVSERLTTDSVTDWQVRAEGQGISIAAMASIDQLPQLHAVAKSTECETWAGPLICPTTVKVNLETPMVESAVEVGRPHDFSFVKTVGEIQLRGEVPDEAQHARILNLVGNRFGRVNNHLSISNETATGHYSQAVDRALEMIGHFKRGQVTWTDTVLNAIGLANSEGAANAVSRFDAMKGDSTVGHLDIQLSEDLQHCNEGFNSALSSSTIQFRSGSASIQQHSEPLLKQLADLARLCPGRLTVEGHTDSNGDAEMNQKLSYWRATAVRDALTQRGIDGTRITAKGYGETQPIVDNSTPEGRAKNRRIVIKIDEMG